MNIGVFDRHGALNSQPVFAALRAGFDRQGLSHKDHDMDADIAIIWSVVWAGRMRYNLEVWNHFRRSNRPVIVAEVGTLRRNHTWKLGLNGTGSSGAIGHDIDPGRPERLGIKLFPWNHQGQHIILALQREDSEQWATAPERWIESTVDTLRQHTSREIVVRPHPRFGNRVPFGLKVQQPRHISGTYDSFDLERSLQQAWAVVNWNSGVAPLAAIHGVPVWTGHDSLAQPVANFDLAQIEQPIYPDRRAWLEWLCHTEWTLDELATGRPFMRLIQTL